MENYDFMTLYFDKNKNIIVIGTVQDGPFRACGEPVILPTGYSERTLGDRVVELNCQMHKINVDAVDFSIRIWETATGLSWRAFFKKYYQISIFWGDQHTIRFEYWKHSNKNSYVFCNDCPPLTIPMTESGELIGKTIITLIEDVLAQGRQGDSSPV